MKIIRFLAISGECLRCYTCDGPQECANPREEQCPKNNECFTVAENYDVKQNGLRKGCAPTCDRVNLVGTLCRTCRSDLCNGKTGIKHLNKLFFILFRQKFKISN
ncbi:unnamed protein product [Gongylonema pulchrum]|uniref:Snake toxin/toxin-like domain-containing protein n=1 Tax=Gongylonema pulchrum TaxID=637853 RepID=A0A3P6RAZ9_9BILA|nr:unnamed protein product [Gongylonema pulchrum]